jgi:hypothetical protein
VPEHRLVHLIGKVGDGGPAKPAGGRGDGWSDDGVGAAEAGGAAMDAGEEVGCLMVTSCAGYC